MIKHKNCARSAFAVAIAAGSLCLLALMGGTLGFISSGASRAVVRTLGDHACHDLCLSALAEALVTVADGARADQTVGGVALREALRREFPFREVTIPTPAALALGKRVHPDLTLGQVTLRPVGRSAPGQEDPLVGTVELVVKVSGRIAGVACGLQVGQRFPFRVRCVQYAQHGRRGTYLRFHWGEAFLAASPVASVVMPL